MQPARVQHHRLHLRPRGTDVSAGPLRSAGDAGWPWGWPQRVELMAAAAVNGLGFRGGLQPR